MGVSFGSYDGICQSVALVVCPLLGTTEVGITPTCYSRNVEFNTTLIFQPATCFIHIVALIMTAIMIYHIRSKYTAVGRKEIVMFFYLFAIDEILALFLDSAIIPTASNVYPWFTAVYEGFVTATFWCLLINGFVGFQFAEDGTPKSLWFLRLTSLGVGIVSFFISIATFRSWASFSPAKPIGLQIVQLIFPLAVVAIYVVLQIVLVLRTLDDRWPLGDILFGVAFFAIAVVVEFAFSNTICDAVKHYIDGLFFGCLCMLLSVMMVYKYWDSITKEDLEFSVGSKAAVWEVKDPLLGSNVGSNAEVLDDRGSVMGGSHALHGGSGSGYGGFGQVPPVPPLPKGGYGYPPSQGGGGGYGGGY